MDIELISRMVGELILENDKVGLPGLGTFVSEFVPASFSDRGYTINPPYKRLLFSPEIINDGLIVSLYASRNSIGEDQAEVILRRFLDGVKMVLKDCKTVVFPGLGKLRATKENDFFFVSQAELAIYPEAFGLEPVSLKNLPLSAEQQAEEMADFAEMVERSRRQGEAEEARREAAETPAPDAPGAVEAPEPVAEEAAEAPAESVAGAGEPKGRKGRALRVFLLVVVIAAAVALALIAVLGRLAPDVIDPLLYSPDELAILRY
ncbi:MAG: hypothetical protein MJY44_06225 [Bacteroidales bacterium]|nr:hypothetical protein [Bacteroidales bacterium]